MDIGSLLKSFHLVHNIWTKVWTPYSRIPGDSQVIPHEFPHHHMLKHSVLHHTSQPCQFHLISSHRTCAMVASPFTHGVHYGCKALPSILQLVILYSFTKTHLLQFSLFQLSQCKCFPLTFIGEFHLFPFYQCMYHTWSLKLPF